jgi:hypothetical protein
MIMNMHMNMKMKINMDKDMDKDMDIDMDTDMDINIDTEMGMEQGHGHRCGNGHIYEHLDMNMAMKRDADIRHRHWPKTPEQGHIHDMNMNPDTRKDMGTDIRMQ